MLIEPNNYEILGNRIRGALYAKKTPFCISYRFNIVAKQLCPVRLRNQIKLRRELLFLGWLFRLYFFKRPDSSIS